MLQVGLGDKIKNINDNIDNYSNGELKRVEIARAIYFDSPIIIFDEAFTGIDNENKTKIVKIIKEQFSEKIFFFITHDENLKIYNKVIQFNK